MTSSNSQVQTTTVLFIIDVVCSYYIFFVFSIFLLQSNWLAYEWGRLDWWRKKPRRRFLLNSSNARAKSLWDASLQILDSVRERNPPRFVAIDEAEFDGNMRKLTGGAHRDFVLFYLQVKGSWTRILVIAVIAPGREYLIARQEGTVAE